MSLKDIFTDDSGILDKTRSQNGTGTSTKSQVSQNIDDFVNYHIKTLLISASSMFF